MATQAAHITPSARSLPLYRMDIGLYDRLVEAGALEGLDVELRDGLLLDRHPHREDPIHRLDTATYDRMVATGALEGEPVELLEGLLVAVMSPQSPEHATVIMRLTHHFKDAKARLRVQLPLDLKPGSEPEPDLTLAEGEPPRGRHYRTASLAIEVSMTSHYKDREVKASLYAKGGIPVYWLVDIPAKKIEIYSDPGVTGYGRREVHGPGDTVPSLAEGVPDLEVAWLFKDLEG
jgi:Uma2 family endonuclease